MVPCRGEIRKALDTIAGVERLRIAARVRAAGAGRRDGARKGKEAPEGAGRDRHG